MRTEVTESPLRVDRNFNISIGNHFRQNAKERKGVLWAYRVVSVWKESPIWELWARLHVVRWAQLGTSANSLRVPLQHRFGNTDSEYPILLIDLLVR
jgi:hypothetical protein